MPPGEPGRAPEERIGGGYHHEGRSLHVLAFALSAEAVEPDDRDDHDALTDLLEVGRYAEHIHAVGQQLQHHQSHKALRNAADAAGKENELIFGMLTPEVNNLKQVGYHPNAFITGDDVANAALNFLERGWNGENFHEVTENLRSSDPYMVMADFKDYRRAQADLQRLYADREHWAKMSLKNIANSGIFSAGRAVLDYARDIWHASTVPMGK